MSIAYACTGLAAGWKGRRVLSGVDLSLRFSELGQCLPIVGRTGIGKSTLLYVMSGMALPMAGRLAWHLPSREAAGAGQAWSDVAWSAGNRREFEPAAGLRARGFGFLLQDAAMIPCLTVRENLLHGLQLRGVPGTKAEKLARISAAVSAMAIRDESVESLLDVYPGTLSGGQRQRMALAAATVHDPVVLFADEPTASLDDETGLQVLRSIRAWLDAAERPGDRAFVFVTHSLRIIRDGVGSAFMLRLTANASRAGPLHLAWEETP